MLIDKSVRLALFNFPYHEFVETRRLNPKQRRGFVQCFLRIRSCNDPEVVGVLRINQLANVASGLAHRL